MAELAPGGRARGFGLGVGPLIFIPALTYLLVLVPLRLKAAHWLRWSFLPRHVCLPPAYVLLVIGLSCYLLAFRQLRRAARAGRLATGGMFRCCRHPIYASWILVILPGLSLVLGTVLALAVVPYALLVFRLFIGDEERELEGRFGEAYRAYRGYTPALIPWPRRWRRTK